MDGRATTLVRQPDNTWILTLPDKSVETYAGGKLTALISRTTEKRTMVYDGLSLLKQQIGGTNPLADITLHTYDSNGGREARTR